MAWCHDTLIQVQKMVFKQPFAIRHEHRWPLYGNLQNIQKVLIQETYTESENLKSKYCLYLFNTAIGMI